MKILKGQDNLRSVEPRMCFTEKLRILYYLFKSLSDFYFGVLKSDGATVKE